MRILNNATFSIVVPLFNEEENVNSLADAVLKAVGDDTGFLELILVDDGSADRTAALVLELAENDERIRLIQHECNKGLGGAIRTGLSAAQGDFVLYTDADLPFDFSLIPQLFAAAGDDRVVSGYRLNRGEGGRRWILTKGYNSLIWLFFGLSLRDVNFACKVFPKGLLQKAEFNSDGSFIDVEMLLEARRLDLEIIQRPLVYYPRERGLSTLSRPEVIFFILKEMFEYIATFFSDLSSVFRLISLSPLIKLVMFLATMLTSITLLADGDQLNQGAAWFFLTVETGIISSFLGWRVGLLASLATFISTALFSAWNTQPVLNQATYHVFIWALLGIAFSEVGSRSWRFIQESVKLKTSE